MDMGGAESVGYNLVFECRRPLLGVGLLEVVPFERDSSGLSAARLCSSLRHDIFIAC